jgi:hypothetical protein
MRRSFLNDHRTYGCAKHCGRLKSNVWTLAVTIHPRRPAIRGALFMHGDEQDLGNNNKNNNRHHAGGTAGGTAGRRPSTHRVPAETPGFQQHESVLQLGQPNPNERFRECHVPYAPLDWRPRGFVLLGPRALPRRDGPPHRTALHRLPCRALARNRSSTHDVVSPALNVQQPVSTPSAAAAEKVRRLASTAIRSGPRSRRENSQRLCTCLRLTIVLLRPPPTPVVASIGDRAVIGRPHHHLLCRRGIFRRLMGPCVFLRQGRVPSRCGPIGTMGAKT